MSNKSIAITANSRNQFGCPYCGFRSCYSTMSGGGTASLSCGECRKEFLVLADGITKSAIGIGSGDSVYYPELQPHPRVGMPSHGIPDKTPEGGGEFFNSRGIGSDRGLRCFCCGFGESKSFINNISAFVQCKEAGERVVVMFDGARLDYRESEPDRVQVKIGACGTHLENLKRLDALTGGGIIKKEFVLAAIMNNTTTSA